MWFTLDLEEDTSETARHKPSDVPKAENKYNMLASSSYKPYKNKVTENKRAHASESHKHNVNKRV